MEENPFLDIRLAEQPEGALFPIGDIIVTAAASEAILAAGLTAIELVTRHARGDYGTIGNHAETPIGPKERQEYLDVYPAMSTPRIDRIHNNVAIINGDGSVLSTFKIGEGELIWVQTSLGSETSVALESENEEEPSVALETKHDGE